MTGLLAVERIRIWTVAPDTGALVSEDCAREMIRRVIEAYPDMHEKAFVMARQENLETIHRHNVVAERYGTAADLRQELESGEHVPHHLTMREWLEAPAA